MTMPQCTAKSKRSGVQCRNMAMPNGKCRMHGGKSTGAPKGSQNGLKHGIYSKFLTEEEKLVSNSLELDQIDDELRLCKVRLMRALKLEGEQLSGEDGLELTSKTVEPAIIGGVPMVDDDIGEIVRRSYSKKDYSPIVERLIARIQSLTQTRMQLLSQQVDIEVRMIELERLQSENSETESKPISVNIQVQNARKP